MRRVIFVLTLATMAAVACWLWLNWDSAAFMTWKRGANPVWFFAALAALPAFGMPMTPFFLLAGTFGSRLALVGTAIALGVNLTASYWIARSALKPLLTSLLQRFSYELPPEDQRKGRAIRFTLAVKLAPGLPSFVKNYVLAIVGVPFGTYLILSMLITGVYAAVLISLGESLLSHDLSATAVIAGIFVALAGAAWWWQRRATRRRL